MSQASSDRRARIFLVLAGAAFALAVITAIWPDWIERVTGLEPDGGNGSLEFIIPVALVILGALNLRFAQRAKVAAEPD